MYRRGTYKGHNEGLAVFLFYLPTPRALLRSAVQFLLLLLLLLLQLAPTKRSSRFMATAGTSRFFRQEPVQPSLSTSGEIAEALRVEPWPRRWMTPHS